MTLGRVTIYVDSEVVTSFNGILEQWMHREKFIVPRLQPVQTKVGDTPEPQLIPHKTIELKIHAQLMGTVLQLPLDRSPYKEQYICLFCYNYNNPTEKQMYLDVMMARGQMRNIL